MATIKSYTDLEQSKTLAYIISLESADAFYALDAGAIITEPYITMLNGEKNIPAYKGAVPCWSLATLLDTLPRIINNEMLFIQTSFKLWHIGYRNIYTARADNLVDACIEIILKLHEMKLL